MKPEERIGAFVDALLQRRRPARFQAAPEELEAAQSASELVSARPGADVPDQAFIERLGHRLRAEMEPAQRAQSWSPSRRALLRTAGFAAAAGVAGALADRALTQPAPQVAQTLIPTNGTWRAVAAVQDVPSGGALPFTSGPVQGFVVNDGTSIKAVSAVCTHMGCILQLELARRLLSCPCHVTTFGLNGKLIAHQLPAPPRDLPALEARVRDGQVEVLVV